MSEAATGPAGTNQAASAAALTGKPAYDRAEFLSSYCVFCQGTERIYQEVLMIRKLPVDTYQLWAAVRDQGGYQQVQQRKLWAATARLFNHPKSWTNASHYFRTTYESAGLAELEDLVDSGRFSITLFKVEEEEQQQQHHTLGSDLMTMGGGSSDTIATPHLTRAALPLSLQQQAAAAMSHTATSQDDTQQQSNSLISSGSGFGTSVVQQQQQQQQRSNPYAMMRLAVRCGTSKGIFDIARQRATCYCAVCITCAGPGGVDMMPTEFERHGGCGSFKKWKKSIIVEETGRNLGTWLNQHGVVIMSPSAMTKKVKKRQLEETLEANRASGNYDGAAAAVAGPGAGNSRGLEIMHAPAVAGHALQQQHQLQLQAYPRFELHPFTAASDHMQQAEYVPKHALQRVFRTSSSASRQLHYPPAAAQSASYQQYRLPSLQYSLTQHDIMPNHPLGSSWDDPHVTLNLSPESSGFSHHRSSMPGCCKGQTAGANSMVQYGSEFRPQHRPEGFVLVGSRIRVWWPLDREWYCAAVQAYNPALQQHMLLYDDGDLEQLNLAEQQWELAAAAPAAAAAVGEKQGPGLQVQVSGSPQSTGTQQLPSHNPEASPRAAAAAAAAGLAAAGAAAATSSRATAAPAAAGVKGIQAAVPMNADAPTTEQLQQQQYNLHCSDHRQYSPAVGSTPEKCDDSDTKQQQYHRTASRQYSPAAGWKPEDSNTDDSEAAAQNEWLAAAEAAAAARPLRVMWDGHAGLMRIIAAADLLLAEQEMRHQQQQQLKHQLQQQHQQQQQRKSQMHKAHKRQSASQQQQQQNWHPEPLPASLHAHADAAAGAFCAAPSQQQQQQQQQDWHPDPAPASSHAATPAHAILVTPTATAAGAATAVATVPADIRFTSMTAAAAAAAPSGNHEVNDQIDPARSIQPHHDLRPPWLNPHTSELAGSYLGSQQSHCPLRVPQQQQQQHDAVVWQQQAGSSTDRVAVSCSVGMSVALGQPANLPPHHHQQHEVAGNSAHYIGGMPMVGHLRPGGLQQQQQQPVSACEDLAAHSRHKADLPTAHHLSPANLQQQQQQQRGLGAIVTSKDAVNTSGSPVECQVQACQDPPGYYEVLAMLPGYSIQDVRITAWDDGRLLIKAAKQYSSTPIAEACTASGSTVAGAGNRSSTAAAVAADGNPSSVPGASERLDETCTRAGAGHDLVRGHASCWVLHSVSGGGPAPAPAPAPVETLVQLPGRVDSKSASALMTQEGELYVRIRWTDLM